MARTTCSVENNVTYNTVGHCFFLEDGIEHGNQFVRNLAIQTKCHTSKPCDPTNLAPFGATAGTNFNTTGQDSKDVLIPSDNTVSTFLDHQSGQHLPRQRGRGFRRDRFLVRLPGASDGPVRRHGDQQGNLAASHEVPRVQGQRRPFEL